jgi:serine/threonine protein kinase
MTLSPGTQLGPYEILAPLGAGAMGEVYRARDPRLDREVAIKVLPADREAGAAAAARFEREAKAVASLSHPAILEIYDVGEAEVSERERRNAKDEGSELGGSPASDALRPSPFAVRRVSYIVTELLEGETLRARLTSGPVPVSTAIDWARHIAEGLAAAHEKRIVHRDLKPENLFVTCDGRVKILDFGLAARREPLDSAGSRAPTVSLKTEPCTALGTPAYMSPEQVRGEAVDARSDVFSLGAVLYEMLSGRRPFQRDSAAETLAAILRDDPLRLSESGRDLPPGLVRLVLHCLEKNRELRFQSARDLAFGLEALSGGSPAGPVPSALPPSIAVLPLADMSPGRDQDYFCEGMAEELINALARIEGIQVASRTSSFQFKGSAADIGTIGERLRVRTVLEGSLRKAEDRLRITIQLINVSDGYHLWSGRFDRRLEDVFAIQEEIATEVARALRVVLTESERRKLARSPTALVEAYELYLKGRRMLHRVTRRGLDMAQQLFEDAVAMDPGFASAHAGIADACSYRYLWYGGRADDLRRTQESGRRAVELDPELAEAHVALGNAAFLLKRQAEAEREFRTAIRLNPRLFEAYYFYARLRARQVLRVRGALREGGRGSTRGLPGVVAPRHGLQRPRPRGRPDADREAGSRGCPPAPGGLSRRQPGTVSGSGSDGRDGREGGGPGVVTARPGGGAGGAFRPLQRRLHLHPGG